MYITDLGGNKFGPMIGDTIKLTDEGRKLYNSVTKFKPRLKPKTTYIIRAGFEYKGLQEVTENDIIVIANNKYFIENKELGIYFCCEAKYFELVETTRFPAGVGKFIAIKDGKKVFFNWQNYTSLNVALDYTKQDLGLKDIIQEHFKTTNQF